MQLKKQITIITFCFLIIALLGVYFFQPKLVLSAASAAPIQTESDNQITNISNFSSLAFSWKKLNPTNLNPSASVKSMREALGRIALLITGLAGALALALFILGAIYMMTSAGNKQRAQRGKEIITWTLIGLIGILLSYFLLRYILKIF